MARWRVEGTGYILLSLLCRWTKYRRPFHDELNFQKIFNTKRAKHIFKSATSITRRFCVNGYKGLGVSYGLYCKFHCNKQIAFFVCFAIISESTMFVINDIINVKVRQYYRQNPVQPCWRWFSSLLIVNKYFTLLIFLLCKIVFFYDFCITVVIFL